MEKFNLNFNIYPKNKKNLFSENFTEVKSGKFIYWKGKVVYNIG